MRRPFFILTIFFALGILAAYAVGDEGVFFTLLCLVAAVLIRLRGQGVSLFPVLLALAFIFGQAVFLFKTARGERAVSDCADLRATVVGRVCSAPETGGEKTGFTLKVTEIQTGNKIIPAGFKTQYTYYGGDCPGVDYGDIISAKVRFSFPQGPKNFGAFNSRLYLRARGIYVSAYGITPLRVVGRKMTLFNPADFAALVRSALIKRGAGAFSGDILGFYNAFILGHNSLMTGEFKTALSKSGLSHVAAVSGYHVSIVISILMFFTYLLGGKRRVFRFLFIAATLFFVLLCGCGPSVLRAGVMFCACQAAGLFYRESDSYTSLAIAVFAMLVYNPYYIFDIGFILSVSSTFGILLLANPIGLYLTRLPLRVAQMTAVTVSAQIFTIPIIMTAYNYVTPYALFANLVVLPFTPAAMALGLMFAFFGNLFIVGKLIALYCRLVFGVFVILVRFFASLPFSALPTPDADIFFSVAFYGFWVFAFFCMTKKPRFFRAVALSVVGTALACGMVSGYISGRDMYIEFINVGKGDSALVRVPGNIAVMIDGGGEMDYDVGREIVGEYLYGRGIYRVDYAFVSHYHLDHADGILSLVEDGRVKNLMLPEAAADNGMREKLLAAADKTKTRVRFFGYGNYLAFPSGAVFSAVAPRPGESELNDINELSAVIRLDYGAVSALFTGDIEEKSEKRICALAENVDCDILKVPHHGSKTSSSEPFIRAVSPEYAVFSGGAVTESAETVIYPRYLNAGAKIYNTYDRGTIVFRANKKTIVGILTSKENAK